MEKITVQQIMEWKPCYRYPEEKVQEIIGNGKTPLEILELDLPVRDKFWLLFREEVISEKQLLILASDFAQSANIPVVVANTASAIVHATAFNAADMSRDSNMERLKQAEMVKKVLMARISKEKHDTIKFWEYEVKEVTE